MQEVPLCLFCKKANFEDLTCTAYPKGIPENILHGADCRFWEQKPGAPPPFGGPPKIKKSAGRTVRTNLIKLGKRAWSRGR